jgi:hypothetical protein
MLRVKIYSLPVLVFAIFLSSCAPFNDNPKRVATYASSAPTQTAGSGIPATATSAFGPTLAGEATPTSIPGGVIPSLLPTAPFQTLYQSPSLGIQFSYPSAWYRNETNNGVTLTSFDPAKPPHKLEWTDQTISMQFGYKVLITPPASFEAWVESATQVAVSAGLSVYAEELVQLLFANQPAAHLTLVSGSGGIIHQVLTDLNGRYFEINIEGNYIAAKAVLDSIQSSDEGVLKSPDSVSPAAGVCADASGGLVNIVLGFDASGLPLAGRCVAVNPAQRLKLINQSDNPIKTRLMEYPITLPAGGEIFLDRPVGQYLALGVHFLDLGPELWVKENVPVTVPPPIVEYNNSALGYRLSLPGDWVINETHSASKEVIFSPPYAEPFIAYLSVSLDSRELDQVIDHYAQNKTFLNVVREDTMFNGHPAVNYIFAGGRNEYFIPHGTQLFLIATDRPNDGLLQSILMTIRFTASSQPVTYDATMADSGKTFVMNIGDKLRIHFDWSYDWSAISISNPAILAGAQDGYFAFTSGTATLTATGNPQCLNSTPPCGMPSMMFIITVIVR